MTHTTIRAGIRPQALPISSLRGSLGKRQQRWIYLYWIMLSLVVEALILWVEGTTVSGRQGYFRKRT
jgi:hypothetical protein